MKRKIAMCLAFIVLFGMIPFGMIMQTKEASAATANSERRGPRILIERNYYGNYFVADGKKYKYKGQMANSTLLRIEVNTFTFIGHPTDGHYYAPVYVRFSAKCHPSEYAPGSVPSGIYGYPQMLIVEVGRTNLTGSSNQYARGAMISLDISPKVTNPTSTYTVSGENALRFLDSVSIGGSYSSANGFGGTIEANLLKRQYQTTEESIVHGALEISTRACTRNLAEWKFDYITSRTNSQFNHYCSCDTDQEGMLSWVQYDYSEGPWPSMTCTVKCEFGMVKDNSTELYFMHKGYPNSTTASNMQLEFYNGAAETGKGFKVYDSNRGTVGKTVTLTFGEH
ncbi:MAG: hypothetical protein K6E71_07850 [Lachnospiraceae bacterium]|nr:hypothetical protein [Lachnospiraceae bacterium]